MLFPLQTKILVLPPAKPHDYIHTRNLKYDFANGISRRASAPKDQNVGVRFAFPAGPIDRISQVGYLFGDDVIQKSRTKRWIRRYSAA